MELDHWKDQSEAGWDPEQPDPSLSEAGGTASSFRSLPTRAILCVQVCEGAAQQQTVQDPLLLIL